MSKTYTTSYTHIEVKFPNKGFRMEAKDGQAFANDAQGFGVLTDFFIELEALKSSQIDDLLKRYKITVWNKPK